MAFHEADGLKYYTFDSFDRYGLKHGIFTRHGGVSPAPWASFNHGGTTGDSREHVIENRERMFSVFGLPVESIFDSWQVHGRDVICTDQPRPLEAAHRKADSILTDRKEVTLVMRFADCVPVFLYDPEHQVVGIAHAGWQGTVSRAAEAAVEAMRARYGSRPANIVAGIGPSICVNHYEVSRGGEVIDAVRRSFGADAGAVLHRMNGAVHFDLQKANQIVLERCGVSNIEQSQLCTACLVEDWFSHRAEKGKTGRFGVLLSAQTW